MTLVCVCAFACECVLICLNVCLCVCAHTRVYLRKLLPVCVCLCAHVHVQQVCVCLKSTSSSHLLLINIFVRPLESPRELESSHCLLMCRGRAVHLTLTVVLHTMSLLELTAV